MLRVIKSWYDKYLSEQDAVILLTVLIVVFGSILFMGSILAPILASIVIAYLLQGWTDQLRRLKLPRTIAYLTVYFTFLTAFVVILLLFLPLVWKQIASLVAELPQLLPKSKALLMNLSQEYPTLFSEQQISSVIAGLIKDVQSIGKMALSASISTIPGVVAFMLYLVLIPLLVFFFLKDDKKIIKWFIKFLPENKKLLAKVWQEIDCEIGNYIGGKVTEILIVGILSYLLFIYFGINYSLLLATIVGLSVIVPYIGAVVATIPVVIVAYIQWGWTGEFGYLVLFYFILQVLDGNLLVPILFSEAVNLHPVAIITGILVFGSLWGFWGVFFAIPLVTVIKTLINAWPKAE